MFFQIQVQILVLKVFDLTIPILPCRHRSGKSKIQVEIIIFKNHTELSTIFAFIIICIFTSTFPISFLSTKNVDNEMECFN